MSCRTAGYLYRQTDEDIVVLMSMSIGGFVDEGIQIPRVAVQKITVWRDASDATEEGQ